MIHLGWLAWAAGRPERFRVSSLLVRPGPLLAEWPPAVRVETLSHLDQARSRLERWVSTRLIDRPWIVARRFRRYGHHAGLAFWLVLTRDWVDDEEA